MAKSVEILLVEDSEADAELVQIAFRSAKVMNQIHTVDDGEKAMQFLRREPP
ncbi:MAG: response regulator, partial [Gemmatimonadetes bacterium]|nr:response regulator [Gemmatimonadota bacterium]